MTHTYKTTLVLRAMHGSSVVNNTEDFDLYNSNGIIYSNKFTHINIFTASDKKHISGV